MICVVTEPKRNRPDSLRAVGQHCLCRKTYILLEVSGALSLSKVSAYYLKAFLPSNSPKNYISTLVNLLFLNRVSSVLKFLVFEIILMRS